MKYDVMFMCYDGRSVHNYFNSKDYETDKDCYDAMLDFVRGCRFSYADYAVFKEDGTNVELMDL